MMTTTRTKLHKIAMGGGCHWCTEAIYQALRGVVHVEQGFVASVGADSDFSEAVIIHYEPDEIDLKTLIKVHLLTHQSTSDHSMRHKYRSAIYTFSKAQYKRAQDLLGDLKAGMGQAIVTKIYPFGSFKPSDEQFQNYYLKNPQKPFCQRYIDPKLKLILNQFPAHTAPLAPVRKPNAGVVPKGEKNQIHEKYKTENRQ